MKLLRLTASALLMAFVVSTANAAADDQSGINNPITQAVLGAYEKMLKEDPKDYETYFKRASEYYRHGEYLRALADVDKAVQYTPESNAQMMFQALMLRASIYQQSHKPELALDDLRKAVALDATDYIALYQKANTEYELGKYSEAKADYQLMQRLNSRSVEALIGMARVAVKENNLGLANDYLDQAVQLDSSSAEVFLRRASVRKSMGNDNGAVEDILVALSIDSENTRAIQSLIDYADTNYSAVMAGLSNAVSQAPRVGMFRYLRAVIAEAHYHYTAAITDYDAINREKLYDYPGIYASIASCQYHLGRFDQALDNIDTALNSITDNPQYFILRSRILRALGRYDQAVEAAAKASVMSRDNTGALMQMALCYISKQDYEQAASLLGEASLTDTQTPYLYMLRSWLLADYLKQPVAARQFCNHVLDMDNYSQYNVKSLRGFAYLYGGDKDRAIEWMDKAIESVVDHDGLVSYYAACLYAMMDDSDKALEYVERSLQNGYGNYYDWMYNNDARINVDPLRVDLRFLHLLDKYKHLFE